MDRKAAQDTLAKLSPGARAAFEASEIDGVDPDIMAEFINLGLAESRFDWTDKASDVEHSLRERESAASLLERIAGEDFPSSVDQLEGWADDDVLDDFALDPLVAKQIIAEACATIRLAYDKALASLAVLGGLDTDAEAA